MAKVQGRQVIPRLKTPELPSVTIRPIDTFYVPKAPPVSPMIRELANTLSDIQPTLMRYLDTKELKRSKVQEAKATKLYNDNKFRSNFVV